MQSADRWIPALWDPDGVVHCDVEGIGSVLSNFYTSLFSEEPCDLVARNEILSKVSSSLPSECALLCEGPLSLEECFAALRGMARGKAPGVHGLPMEFYLKFWDVLASDLADVLNCCLGRGYLGKSQRCGSSRSLSKREIGLTPVIGALSLFCVLTTILHRAPLRGVYLRLFI